MGRGVGPRAGRSLLEDALAPRRLEGVELEREVLVGRRDPGVANEHFPYVVAVGGVAALAKAVRQRNAFGKIARTMLPDVDNRTGF